MTRAAASRGRAPRPRAGTDPRSRALPGVRVSRQEGPDAVRPLHHALRLRRRRRDAGRRPRQPAGAGRPGRAARLRRGLDGGAPLRPLRSRGPAESDPRRGGPGRADEPDPDRPDGEHRPLVASHPAGRGPGHPGQPHAGPGRRRLRPRHLALRGAAVPSARRPEEGPGEPRALSRDRRDRAEGLDRGAVRPRGARTTPFPPPTRGSRIRGIRPTRRGRTAIGS